RLDAVRDRVAVDAEAHGREAEREPEQRGEGSDGDDGGQHQRTSPAKPMNASDIMPAVTRPIAAPWNAGGTSATAMRSRIAANATSTSEKPSAAPTPYSADATRPWSSCTFRSATPSTAQFVVINGR